MLSGLPKQLQPAISLVEHCCYVLLNVDLVTMAECCYRGYPRVNRSLFSVYPTSHGLVDSWLFVDPAVACDSWFSVYQLPLQLPVQGVPIPLVYFKQLLLKLNLVHFNRLLLKSNL